MKRLFILFLFAFFVNTAFCSAAYYTVKMSSPEQNYSLRYEDDDVYIVFGMARKNPDSMFISIYNKTSALITANWPKASIVFNNKARSVIPASQLITGLNSTSGVASSTIPPGTSSDERIFAEGSIAFINEPVVVRGGIGWGRGWGHHGWGGWAGYDDFIVRPGWYGKWRTKAFFPTKKSDIEESDPTGEVFSIYLPLVINEKESVKNFDFKVDSVSTEDSPGSIGISVADQKELVLMKKELQIESGIAITNIAKKSPAKNAGLKVDDNIIKIDGTDINSLEDFYVFMKDKKAKEKIVLTYLRDGKKQSATITLKKV